MSQPQRQAVKLPIQRHPRRVSCERPRMICDVCRGTHVDTGRGDPTVSEDIKGCEPIGSSSAGESHPCGWA